MDTRFHRSLTFTAVLDMVDMVMVLDTVDMVSVIMATDSAMVMVMDMVDTTIEWDQTKVSRNKCFLRQVCKWLETQPTVLPKKTLSSALYLMFIIYIFILYVAFISYSVFNSDLNRC